MTEPDATVLPTEGFGLPQRAITYALGTVQAMTLPALLKTCVAWVTLALCVLGLLAAQGVRLSCGAVVLPWEATFWADRWDSRILLGGL